VSSRHSKRDITDHPRETNTTIQYVIKVKCRNSFRGDLEKFLTGKNGKIEAVYAKKSDLNKSKICFIVLFLFCFVVVVFVYIVFFIFVLFMKYIFVQFKILVP